jgi:hypothetical protein
MVTRTTDLRHRARVRACRHMLLSLLFSSYVVFFLPGCDHVTEPQDVATTLEDMELAKLADSLSADLGASRGQAQKIRQALELHRNIKNQPGFLWKAAGELYLTLSDEQKQNLFDLIERYEAQLAGEGLIMIFEGWPGLSAKPRMRSIHCSVDLTDEQERAMKTIREAYKKRTDALKRGKRNGVLSESEYGRSMSKLLAAVNEEFLDLLTDRQKAIWRRCLASAHDIVDHPRDEAYQVMVRVLGLTGGQVDSLVELKLRLANAYRGLLNSLQEGTIDRDEFIDRIWELRNSRERELAGILDQRQYDIVRIHRALALRMAVNTLRDG